ncbi:MAG: hypothetical protein R3B06_10920 [Kofleriaceae bacterium]
MDDATTPPPIDLSQVRTLVAAARARLRVQGALEGAATSAVAASASALTAVFLVRTEAVSPGAGVGLLVASAGVIGVGALVGALGRHDDELVARRIDRASGLADRLSSAIAFERALGTASADDAATADLMRAAMRDAAAAAPRADVKAATPLTRPRDTTIALAFAAVAAVAASFGVALPPRDPVVTAAVPAAARRGAEVVISGARLCGAKAAPTAPCSPEAALVYVGDDGAAVAAPIVAWTGGGVSVTVPAGAKLGATELVVWARGKRLGAVPFEVIADDDPRNFKDNTVALSPDDQAYMRDLVADLRATAKHDDVPELEEYAAKIEKLLDLADQGQLTKDELLEAMQQAQAELDQHAEDHPEQIDKDLAETGTELAKNELTKELGAALKQGDLDKAKQEMEKLADKLDAGELSQQQSEQLAKTLEQAAKQYQQKQDEQAKQQQAQTAKAEDELRKLEKERDQAKTDQDRADAERRLEKKKDELQKLQKDQAQRDQSAQREALKRLHKDMQKAAEDLQRKQDPSDQKNQDQQNQDNQKQASRSMRDVADETGKVDRDQRKQTAQKKMASQMDDLREAMRRAKQRGKQGGGSPFGKNQQGKNQDFAKRAAGGQGQKGAWKPGQGQPGQGQGQGQPGQGQQGQGNGGQGDQPDGPSKNYGTGHDDNLVGDATGTTGNTKDESVSGAQGRKGPSRRETILSAAQKGYASASYRQVYADYKKIVEDVMKSEKVPASYKYYVKKYFTKIKPHAMD